MNTMQFIFLLLVSFLVSCSSTHEIDGRNFEEVQFQEFKAEGLYYDEYQDYITAIDMYKMALEYKPNDRNTLLLLGMAYGKSGDIEGGLVPLEKAARLYPEHIAVHRTLGYLYREAGKFGKALASFMRVLELKPGDSLAFAHIGIIGYHTKNYQMCRDYLRKYSARMESIDPFMLTEGDKRDYREIKDLLVACENMKPPSQPPSPL